MARLSSGHATQFEWVSLVSEVGREPVPSGNPVVGDLPEGLLCPDSGPSGAQGAVHGAVDLRGEGREDLGNQIGFIQRRRRSSSHSGGRESVVGVASGDASGTCGLLPDLNEALLLVSTDHVVAHGSGFVVDSDEGTVGVNVAVAAGHLVSVPVLLMVDVRLLNFIGNLGN